MCAEYQFYVKYIASTDDQHKIQAIMNRAHLVGHVHQDGDWFVVHLTAEDDGMSAAPVCLCTLRPSVRLAITEILDILHQHGDVYVWPDSFEPEPRYPVEAEHIEPIEDLDHLDDVGMSYCWYVIPAPVSEDAQT